jgi:hypothetical protein
MCRRDPVSLYVATVDADARLETFVSLSGSTSGAAGRCIERGARGAQTLIVRHSLRTRVVHGVTQCACESAPGDSRRRVRSSSHPPFRSNPKQLRDPAVFLQLMIEEGKTWLITDTCARSDNREQTFVEARVFDQTLRVNQGPRKAAAPSMTRGLWLSEML